jgi:preprotein translocase subunit YajC
MIIPDYISPIVGYRVWRWNATGLSSLNGEPWLPGRPLAAGCRAAARGTIVGRAKAMHGPHELPHSDCTCGVYAAKNMEHLRQFGYERRGIHGEVYLWGTVVEHKLGWRAQFAYPKTLFLPVHILPFMLAEMNATLKALTSFGTDIFVLRDGESIRLWSHAIGYDADGLDYIINLRRKHSLRQQQEPTLKEGDRVAVLGRGITVVEQADEQDTVLVLGNKLELRIARKDIVFNQHNLRWECGTNPLGSGVRAKT